ncbi:MAG: nicotinate (nicotinamide) nucleotide adenylyltransferase [Candidatus Glassbacteria bacterium]|nr:nicotinate (nicotinamide) nucleotide adenylyltransferase [Candidatus Glassbacteria bacterium]
MRVAMLGGTFDPVHIGHLIGAQAAWEQLELDKVLLVPAASPPHKHQRNISSAGHRVAMLEAAIAGDERFGLYLEELNRPGRSYTVDTLREYRERFMADGGELFFILGTDNLLEFDSWKDWREICNLARIAVLYRQGYDTDPGELEQQLPGIDVCWVDMPLIGVSATQVRGARAAGRSVRWLVTAAVENYIDKHGLYAPAPS